MNDPISWDPSLVKKFSSSNHYKLLNQLRNEVKKYPLNNKKNTSYAQSKDNNQDTFNKINESQSKSSSYYNKPNHSNDLINNKSTVSFNNAKNFSIYNQASINNRQSESSLPDQPKTNEESSSTSFKDRLNQIDVN